MTSARAPETNWLDVALSLSYEAGYVANLIYPYLDWPDLDHPLSGIRQNEEAPASTWDRGVVELSQHRLLIVAPCGEICASISSPQDHDSDIIELEISGQEKTYHA